LRATPTLCLDHGTVARETSEDGCFFVISASRLSVKRKLFNLFVAFLTAAIMCTVTHGQQKPLTKDQVLTLVRSQMGDEAGAKAVQARGIDFDPTADFLNSLKKAGANDAFLQAVRAAYQPKSSSGQPSEKALSKKQILELLAGDVPSSRVAMLVSDRGIDFNPTDDYLKTLEGAGAESDLLDALRVALPPQVTLSNSTHPVSTDSAADQATQAQVQQHLMQGLQFRKKGQFPEAEQEYRAATNLEPKNPDIWVGLSSVYNQERKFDDAIAAAHQALKLNPDFDRAHVALGVGLGDQGDYQGAAAEFRKAVTLNPDNGIAHDDLGLSLFRQGNTEGALAEYRESLRINPKDDHAHNNFGSALRKQGDLDAAIVQFREAIRINRNNDLAHMNLGAAMAQKGNLKLALEQYRIGCELKPENEGYRRAYDALQRKINQK
jgi:Flp pilus assembly protein TadD